MASFSPPLTDAELHAAFPGRFTKLTPIDAGGQGCVFRAESVGGGPVALKIYAPDPNAHVEERTQREVDAMLRLSCPSMVKVKDHGVIPLRGTQCRFVATSFIEGRTLTSLMDGGPMSLAATAQVAHDIAAAIDALWSSAKIVHRDIKPPNVMAGRQGGAVLIDLGIARHTTLDTLTTPGMAWGTMGFMSPEQFQGRKNLTCKSDVFALGVLLRLCASSIHPTGGNQKLLGNGCSPTSTVAMSLPAEVSAQIDRMLLVAPERRPMPATVMTAFRPFLTPTPW